MDVTIPGIDLIKQEVTILENVLIEAVLPEVAIFEPVSQAKQILHSSKNRSLFDSLSIYSFQGGT